MSESKDKIFVGDIGKIIRVFVGSKVNLSTATLIVFQVKKPNNALVEWTATVDPSNNYYAIYTTEEDDIDLAGTWLLSIEVTFADGSYHQGTTGEFKVYEQFADKDCLNPDYDQCSNC